jgi:predicted transcriptional regulator
VFGDSNKNLELAKKNLKKKYDNIESLTAEVNKKLCNSPELIDDYMLWQIILIYEKQLAAQAADTTGNLPVLPFKVEIIYHTSDFYSVLTPRRAELLEYIQSHNPKSVKALANELNRDYKNVYDDLLALQKYHLLEFVREGKNKRPISTLTAVDILFG